MGDTVDALLQIDRDAAEVYLQMALFLREERKEVKIREHKYHIRATDGGRLRGLYTDILRAIEQYSSDKLEPGMLVQFLEQAKAKIATMKNNANCKSTTLMTLTDDGFLDSDPSGPQEFTDDEMQPLTDRCRHYWLKLHYDDFKQVRKTIDAHYHYLSKSQLDSVFLAHRNIDDVYDAVKKLAAGTYNPALASRLDDSSEDGNDAEEDDDPPVFAVQDEHVASLRSLFPSLSDAEIRHALTQARGDIDLAADLLLRN